MKLFYPSSNNISLRKVFINIFQPKRTSYQRYSTLKLPNLIFQVSLLKFSQKMNDEALYNTHIPSFSNPRESLTIAHLQKLQNFESNYNKKKKLKL